MGGGGVGEGEGGAIPAFPAWIGLSANHFIQFI